MTEPTRITVGMSFGTVGETIKSMEKAKHSRKIQDENSFTYNVEGVKNGNLYNVYVSSISTQNGGITYSARPIENRTCLIYGGEIRGQGIAPDDPNGLYKIKELKYTQITDVYNGQYAKDLNGNGIVDEGEIFEGDWLF